MKKIILSALSALITISSASVDARNLDKAELRGMVGSYYSNTATFFKGESWMLPIKYFAFSGAVGVGVGCVVGSNPAQRYEFARVGGIATGTIGLLGVYLHRYNCVSSLNRFLKEYTAYSSFKDLTDVQAVMLLAAQRKDLSVMRRLLPYCLDFLRHMGIWETLTELYFNEPDSIINNSGSTLTPGFSSRGGFHLNFSMHSSSSKVKQACMAPDLMRRRIRVLQAKLGYRS